MKNNADPPYIFIFISPQNKTSIFPKSDTMKAILIKKKTGVEPGQNQTPTSNQNLLEKDIWKALKEKLYPGEVPH